MKALASRNVARTILISRNCSTTSLTPIHSGDSTLPLRGIRVLDLTRVLAGPFCSMLLGDLGAEVLKIEKPGNGDYTRSWGPPFLGSESCYFLSVNRNKKSVAVDIKSSAGKEIIKQDGPPVKTGVALTDLSTGLYAQGAILAALLHRQQTGCGQWIQCNLLSSQVSLLTHIASNFLNANLEATRMGSAHASIVPYQAFQTSDGWLVVGAGNDKQFTSLCTRIGYPELASDGRFCSNVVRVKNRDELIQLLTTRFKSGTNSHWLQVLEGSDIAYGPINDISQVFEDAQVSHMECVQSVHHSSAGEVKLLSPAVRYSGFTSRKMSPPPRLGEHTRDVLGELLGHDSDQIQALLDSGSISCL